MVRTYFVGSELNEVEGLLRHTAQVGNFAPCNPDAYLGLVSIFLIPTPPCDHFVAVVAVQH